MPDRLSAACRACVHRALGTMPDPLIAKKCGCSRSAVAQMRTKLNIAPCRASPGIYTWTSNRLRQLGSCPDADLARRWRWPDVIVFRKRRILGIPPFQRPEVPVRAIPTEVRRQLGTVPDAHLARRYRIGMDLIALHRMRAGIAAWRPKHRIRWTQRMLDDIPRLSITAFAKRYGMAAGTVRVKRAQLHIPPIQAYRPRIRWTTTMLRDLGHLSDYALARRHGLSPTSVHRKRTSLGIVANAVAASRASQRPPGTPR